MDRGGVCFGASQRGLVRSLPGLHGSQRLADVVVGLRVGEGQQHLAVRRDHEGGAIAPAFLHLRGNVIGLCRVRRDGADREFVAAVFGGELDQQVDVVGSVEIFLLLARDWRGCSAACDADQRRAGSLEVSGGFSELVGLDRAARR